ncbi:kinase-like domain-containing protein [Rhizophagus irregularis DAOM 181602=DAOM 197198]|nr:kinase-like domain-containing protein [Rhizophagus irregularis DAOM 181602=DAOM 197198]
MSTIRDDFVFAASDWIGGEYYEWDSIEKQLKRYGTGKVILKKLKNLESANRSWFDEAKSHLIISNKYIGIVRCYGLTQDPSNGNYILVMKKLDSNLREYLQENHNKLTWKERIKIIVDIINALETIHYENAIHRDLHSGNILYNQYTNYWFISDLGFCGPVDKPLKSIYGNLPYIAPEVTFGKGYTKASDIYSIAMLMWEVSSGQPPFANYENNYNLAMNTVNGIRPKVVSGTPLKYKGLMQQCWDADPTKRPDIVTIRDKIREINKLYHQDTVPNNDMNIIWKFLYSFKTNNLDKISSLDIMSIYASSSLSISKIYQFENLPEPRNATEEEQEAYHSKPYSFNIPEDIDDFNKSNQNTINIFKENSKTLSRIFEKLRLGSGDNKQDNYKKEIVKQKVKNQHVDDDEEDIFNNPNFHSEDQDELEIPDDGF